jgi:hypothetical protein
MLGRSAAGHDPPPFAGDDPQTDRQLDRMPKLGELSS